MNKALIAAVAAATAFSGVLPAGAAAAQPYYAQDRYRDSDRDGRSDVSEWNRDRDRDGRPDQYDRRDGRRWDRHDNRRADREFRYYGGRHGYNGYRGSWRTGQRYPYYNDRQYVISDYRAYRLPPPRSGYRYYRSDNGDVVMAAIASGVIALIIAGALSGNDHEYPRYYSDREYPRY
jgi:Ni/Co efflux regulator RcnB